MRGSGNGDVQVCANNLLHLFRGEVPFERIKGIDTRLIDRPAVDAIPEIQQDAEWLLETYEPRAIVQGIDVDLNNGIDGGLHITANIEETEV